MWYLQLPVLRWGFNGDVLEWIIECEAKVTTADIVSQTDKLLDWFSFLFMWHDLLYRLSFSKIDISLL